ncbi:ABC transporter ATP-binding protein [Vibrio echinoideorum]|uniref:ABC transporter ATP-binding protein n=1 Tax=Vibrio echinoideorum TaxID=2100116 RepID=UPI00354C8696
MSFDKNIAIKVSNVDKHFHVYDAPANRLRQAIYPKLQSIINIDKKQYFKEFPAIKNVSFEISRGETVGIVGRNGSGKSTILQIICGTLSATGGLVSTNGRIAALLELGSGFNPEFTGRENVFMNAAILGLSREETKLRFGEIEKFADIGDFIDQPVKSYSSGMVVRLAFAVSINVDPEILIVDEALSVGDELFQRKCFSKIEEIKKNGATILFVSHSGSTIIDLCDRAILMDAGEKIAEGSPKKIVANYQKLLYSPDDKAQKVRMEIMQLDEFSACSDLDLDSEILDSKEESLKDEEMELYDPNLKPTSTIFFESHGAHITEPAIVDFNGRKVNGLISGRRYKFIYIVNFSELAEHVRFGMVIKTTSGISLGGSMSSPLDESLPVVKPDTKVKVEFEFDCLLSPGMYFLNAGVFGSKGQEEIVLNRIVDAIAIRVLPIKKSNITEIINFNCQAKVLLNG